MDMDVVAGLSLALLVVVAVVGLITFEVFMFLDILKNRKLDSTEKLIWVLGMFLLHPIIAIVYYFVAHTRLNKAKK